MINYILLLVLVIVFAIVIPIVIKLSKNKKGFLAIALVAITLVVSSGATWFVLNNSAESTPPGPDSTATASTQFIDNIEVKKEAPTEESSPDYSEKNKAQNREAVEKFKTLPAAE